VPKVISAKTRARRPARETATEAGLAGPDVNKATVYILRVLSAFAADISSFGVTALSKQLGMTKSMVHRALTTLLDQGYVVRDPTGTGYQLGLRVLELQDPAFNEPDLRTLCAPYLRLLHEAAQETVRLCVRAGDNIVIVDGLEAPGRLASRAGLGAMFPLHVSPASRVILSSLSDDEIRDYIARNSPLGAYTPASITDPRRLWEDIQLTRNQGYAFGYADGSVSVASVAFPIPDAAGQLHGSLVIAGPESRFRPRLLGLMPEFRRIMDDLNARTRLYFANPPMVGPR
jgi:DNA-binding IclR family transcriptional regulator